MDIKLKPEDFPFIQQNIYKHADFIKIEVSTFLQAAEKLYSETIELETLDDYNSFVYNAFISYVTAIDKENTRLTKKLEQCTRLLKEYLGEQKSTLKEIASLEKKSTKDPKSKECLDITREKGSQLEEEVKEQLLEALQIERNYKELSVKFYRSFNPELMESKYEFAFSAKRNGRGEVDAFNGKIGYIVGELTTEQQENNLQQGEGQYETYQETSVEEHAHQYTPEYLPEGNIDYYNQ